MDPAFLTDLIWKLLQALPLTLLLFILSISLGLVLALGLTWLRTSGNPVFTRFARLYIYIFRGTPLLIQLFLINYGLGQIPFIHQSLLWLVLKEPFNCAVLSLALCTAAYQAEIFRGALLAVPHQQVEAARAIGMSGLLLFRRIIAPIVIRQALPSYTTELVLMVKSTSLAGLVTIREMTFVANDVIHRTYQTLPVFLCAGLIYLALNFLLSRFFAWIEHRLSPHLRVMPEAKRPQPALIG